MVMRNIALRRVPIILLAAFLVMVLVGCAGPLPRTTTPLTTLAPASTPTPTQTQTTAIPPRTTVPTGIYQFAAADDGQQDRYYFLLEDGERINVAADGRVKLQIFDDFENSLYLKEFDVKAAQYVDYVVKPGDITAGKMYQWRVSIADIKKGESLLGWGRAVCTFTTLGGTKLSAEYKSARIPVYSDVELITMAEDDYLSKSVYSGEKIRRGDIEVTVVRSGWFRQYKVGVDRKEYFRIDLEVQNTGETTSTFTPFGVILVDSRGNRFEKTLAGSFNTATQLKAGATVKGPFLFDSLPATLKSATLTFESGWDWAFRYYLFEFTIKLAP